MIAVALGSLALLAASPEPKATPPGPPTLVVISRSGGFAPHHDVVWFRPSGVARRDGPGVDRHEGHYRAQVVFSRIARIVSDGGLCTAKPGAVAPAGMDIPYYRVSVKCGDAWTTFASYGVVERAGNEGVRGAVIALTRLAGTLQWEDQPRDDPPPKVPFAAHRPAVLPSNLPSTPPSH